MSCPYYTWRSDFYCTKKQGYVNEDVYYKHCRNYDYDYCPIYKGSDSSSGGCYLTSACVEAKGLPDDCMELTTLRRFRDTWLANQPGGKEEIQLYYQVAPAIVTAIQAKKNAKEIFDDIYRSLILPCVTLIQEGKMDETWKLYRETTEKLQAQY
ncbi:MAG: hypothetical protein IKB65_00615 [Ruminiclostridium sp.]|nr:hypothetical protein [Ruminiclostridium sp.]